MDLSVCIPTYCTAEVARARLVRCVESVRREFPSAEIVVCDDASPHDLRAWDLHDVRLFVHAENKGPYAAMRSAVDSSKGLSVLILDDDVVLPVGFREAFHQLMALPNVGVLSWKSTHLKTGLAETVGAGDTRGVPAGLLDPATELASYCMAFRRELWHELGGLDLRFRCYCADSDFCLRATLAGHPCYRVHWPLVPHEEHQTLNEEVLPGTGKQGSEDLAAFKAKWKYDGATCEKFALGRLRVGGPWLRDFSGPL